MVVMGTPVWLSGTVSIYHLPGDISPGGFNYENLVSFDLGGKTLSGFTSGEEAEEAAIDDEAPGADVLGVERGGAVDVGLSELKDVHHNFSLSLVHAASMPGTMTKMITTRGSISPATSRSVSMTTVYPPVGNNSPVQW